MSNQMSDFLRRDVELNQQAAKLGLRQRVRSQEDVELFFLKAADEIDWLAKVENAAREYLLEGTPKWDALRLSLQTSL